MNSIIKFLEELKEDLDRYFKKGFAKMAINCILIMKNDYTLKLKKKKDALIKD